MVDKAIGAGMLTGFDVSRVPYDPLLISHLLFADDTLIFCEADPSISVTCILSLFGLKLFQGCVLIWANLSWSKLVMCQFLRC